MSKVKVTLIKGINGRKPNHVATVKSLGLRKLAKVLFIIKQQI